MRTRSRRGTTESIHPRASVKPSELSSVVAARGSTQKRRIARIPRDRAAQIPNKIVKRDGSKSPARQLRTVKVPFIATISEKSPAGRVNPSHSGSGAAGRKHGKSFLSFG